MIYACKIKPDTKGYRVQFRDIPEALTGGDTLEDALHHAQDALLTALEFYFDDRRLVPTASQKKRGEHAVAIPALVAAKIELHNEMVVSNKKRSTLARELSLVPSGIDRLLDIRQPTKLETIEQALAIFGRRLEITTVAL
jgi:antitoxin HicB